MDHRRQADKWIMPNAYGYGYGHQCYLYACLSDLYGKRKSYPDWYGISGGRHRIARLAGTSASTGSNVDKLVSPHSTACEAIHRTIRVQIHCFDISYKKKAFEETMHAVHAIRAQNISSLSLSFSPAPSIGDNNRHRKGEVPHCHHDRLECLQRNPPNIYMYL